MALRHVAPDSEEYREALPSARRFTLHQRASASVTDLCGARTTGRVELTFDWAVEGAGKVQAVEDFLNSDAAATAQQLVSAKADCLLHDGTDYLLLEAMLLKQLTSPKVRRKPPRRSLFELIQISLGATASPVLLQPEAPLFHLLLLGGNALLRRCGYGHHHEQRTPRIPRSLQPPVRAKRFAQVAFVLDQEDEVYEVPRTFSLDPNPDWYQEARERNGRFQVQLHSRKICGDPPSCYGCSRAEPGCFRTCISFKQTPRLDTLVQEWQQVAKSAKKFGPCQGAGFKEEYAEADREASKGSASSTSCPSGEDLSRCTTLDDLHPQPSARKNTVALYLPGVAEADAGRESWPFHEGPRCTASGGSFLFVHKVPEKEQSWWSQLVGSWAEVTGHCCGLLARESD